MPKENLDAKLELELQPGTTSRRLRGLSREIGFALALTVAAAASVWESSDRDTANMAFIPANQSPIPASIAPAKTE